MYRSTFKTKKTSSIRSIDHTCIESLFTRAYTANAQKGIFPESWSVNPVVAGL